MAASIVNFIATSISFLRFSSAPPILRRKPAPTLQIQPLQLQFPFELKKQVSCSMRLTNNSDYHVAFKVMTTNPKRYGVKPNSGVVMPHATCDVIVRMQARTEAQPDMQCKDKFLIQSTVVAKPGISITRETFKKVAGKQVDECKLRVILTDVPPPPRPLSPLPQGSEQGRTRKYISESANIKSAPPSEEDGTVNHASDSYMMSKGMMRRRCRNRETAACDQEASTLLLIK